MQPILLKCYLAQHGDNQNMLLLMGSNLVVIFKGKRIDFPLANIKGLSVGRKRLIIPLVGGGIGTCLSWLALSLGWYHYQTNLMLVFLFFGWMYYGFLGRDGLELTEGKHRHVFLIRANQLALNNFLKFVKTRRLMSPPFRESICVHLATRPSWESQELSLHYSHSSLKDEGFIHTSFLSELKTTYEQYFQSSDDLVLIGIDLEKVEAQVKMEVVNSRNATFPHIYGKINKSAIVFLRAVQSPKDIDPTTIL